MRAVAKWMLVSVLCGCLVNAALAQAAGNDGPKNLIENGDFETGTVGPIPMGKLEGNWGRRFPGGRPLEIAAETRPGSPGKQCLKIATHEKSTTGGVYSKLIPLDPTKVLEVSGWMKGGGVLKMPQGVYFGVGWFDKDRKPVILRKGTGLNYTYLGSGYKKPEWVFCKRVFLPSFEGPKEDGPTRYRFDEIPREAHFFDVRIFALEYPKEGYFDDIFASQDAADTDWIVGWEGTRESVTAAREMAGIMSKVLGTEVAAAAWRGYNAKHTFVITDAKHAPPEIAARLKGKRLDAFTIVYPAKLHNREVCLLVANERKALDFPAYYFLTKFMGVEWVGPGDLGEVVTPQPGWQMPAKIDVVEDPSYEHRFWTEHGVNCRKWLAGSFRLQFHHNFFRVFDPKKYADQPDLYPFYNGKRNVPDPKVHGRRVSGWQPCVGNPKARDIAVQYGLDYLAKRPDVKSFSLSVNDGGAGICMCDLCRAMDSKGAFDAGAPHLTDRFFRFNNAVIERVLRKKPDAYLAVLGYGRCQTLPVETKINPRILVFNVCDNDLFHMTQRQRDWKAKGATPSIYLWMWDCGYLTVRNYPHALADLVRVTHELGGFGFYCEALTNWAAGGPKFYVLSHVLWDANADVDALLDRYMRAAFGTAAAPHMRAYFDRWEDVWERKGEDVRYNTGRQWRNVRQLDELTRDDLTALDAALRKANAGGGTAAEKRRIAYVETYYRWLRANADQYLVTRDLMTAKWVAGREPDRVMREIERGLGLTAKFEGDWKNTISKDRTNWLLSWRYHADPDRLWKTLIQPIRTGVLQAYEPAVDTAFDQMTKSMLRAKPKGNVVMFWKTQLGRHPKLAKWIRTQIHTIERGAGGNLVSNGDFEIGKPGGPPAIDGWSTTGSWQGMPADYGWGEGRNGGHAAGISRGYAATWLTTPPTKQGHRYRLTAWYKTSGPRNRIHGGVAEQTLPFRPTNGTWAKATTTFTAAKNGTLLRLNSYGQNKGEWTWFDDVELVEICAK